MVTWKFVNKEGQLIQSSGNYMDMVVLALEKELDDLATVRSVYCNIGEELNDDDDESVDLRLYDLESRLSLLSRIFHTIISARAKDNASELETKVLDW